VSTDHQSVRNQEIELQAVAERHGWTVVAVYRDQGISGAKGREKRPGLDKRLQAVARKEFDMVAAWSVDRLGRSLIDLVGILQEFHAKHVDLYLHQQEIDTTTPSGKAMFQMMGVFAEFERSMIHERVMAGLARAKAEGTRLGRPATVADDAAKVRTIRVDRAAGKSIRSGHWDGFRPRENNYLSRISRHSSAPTRPLAAPDRTGASGPITPRQNFRALNLFVVTPQRAPTQIRRWSQARPADVRS
jgi:DNA invertase Pin-like site-specific DNA recombinase